MQHCHDGELILIKIFDFGPRLKELRENKNLTQKEVAHLVGVSRTSINNYESGDQNPMLDTLVRMVKVYGTSTDYILGLDNRKCIYLDGFTEKQQEIIIDFIDKIGQEMKR